MVTCVAIQEGEREGHASIVQSQDLAVIWEFEYSADLPEVLGCPGEGDGPIWLEIAMTYEYRLILRRQGQQRQKMQLPSSRQRSQRLCPGR